MTRKVWKYTLKDHVNTLSIPEYFEILEVHEQANELCIWVLVDDINEEVKQTFHVIGTGKEFPMIRMEYVGTAHVHFGTLVLHVFMEIEL